jgi:hypothetical protein
VVVVTRAQFLLLLILAVFVCVCVLVRHAVLAELGQHTEAKCGGVVTEVLEHQAHVGDLEESNGYDVRK